MFGARTVALEGKVCDDVVGKEAGPWQGTSAQDVAQTDDWAGDMS
jgi:hypothetical protein